MIKLYGFRRSLASYRVRIALRLKNLPQTGQTGACVPGRTDGRLQRAGVCENCAACLSATRAPQPDAVDSRYASRAGAVTSKPRSTRPSERTHCAVRASEMRACQLPPSWRWRSSAAEAAKAIRKPEA